MKNFKEEILTALNNQHLSPEDIDYVCGNSIADRRVSESGEKLLQDADFFYEENDGVTDIDKTLTIVMKDKSYFTRAEHETREYFVYHKAPHKSSIEGTICLAPLLSVKNQNKIRELKAEITENTKEVERLENIKYTFMS